MGGEPAEPSQATAPVMIGSSREIRLRTASGLVMAAIAGVALYVGGLPFALLGAVVGVLTSFEWSRIVRDGAIDSAVVVQVLSVVVAAGLAWLGLAALAIAVIIAGSILTGLLCFERRPLLSAEGVLYAGLPVVALIWLREDQPNGFAAVLLILIAVVATDVAAFVFGRLIGGPRLAPAISPNKTWSGFLGGISAAGLAAAGFAHTIGADPVMVGVAGVFLGIVAQIGDLTESALKRSFGVKDSGHIIPGHGGIMDRIDGLVFASVAAGFVALALDPQAPSSALLFGV